MSAVLVSCDRWPTGDFKWVNKTSHAVEVTLSGIDHKSKFLLAPGKDTTIHDITGPMSPQSIEEHFYGMRYDVLGDTFKLRYDDGKVLKYSYPDDTVREFSIYNLNANNLQYELWDKDWESSFTYTLTEDQYATAE